MKTTTKLILGFFAVTLVFLIFLNAITVTSMNSEIMSVNLDDTEDIRLPEFTALDLTQEYRVLDSTYNSVNVNITTEAGRRRTLTAPRGFYKIEKKGETLVLQLTDHGRKMLAEGRILKEKGCETDTLTVTINTDKRLNFIGTNTKHTVNLHGADLNELNFSGTTAGLELNLLEDSHIKRLNYVTVSETTNAENMVKYNKSINRENIYYPLCELSLNNSKVDDLSLNMSKGSGLSLSCIGENITNVEVAGTGFVKGLRPDDYSSLIIRPDNPNGMNLELNGLTKEIRFDARQ